MASTADWASAEETPSGGGGGRAEDVSSSSSVTIGDEAEEEQMVDVWSGFIRMGRRWEGGVGRRGKRRNWGGGRETNVAIASKKKKKDNGDIIWCVGVIGKD